MSLQIFSSLRKREEDGKFEFVLRTDYPNITLNPEGFIDPSVFATNNSALTQDRWIIGPHIGVGVNNSFDPHENALGGANYLKQQLNKFGGNLHLALAAYNAGPQAVVKYNGIPPYTETIDYVKKVSGAYQSLKKFEFEKN